MKIASIKVIEDYYDSCRYIRNIVTTWQRDESCTFAVSFDAYQRHWMHQGREWIDARSSFRQFKKI